MNLIEMSTLGPKVQVRVTNSLLALQLQAYGNCEQGSLKLPKEAWISERKALP
jgi:hypothetical protein